jgi:signal transduction histidine kinase
MHPERIEPDLTLPCLIHDLNNVFQTLIEAAELLSHDPRWSQLSAAILRSVERGKGVTASLHAVEQPSPFESILNNAISFVEDSLIAGRGPKIRFAYDIEPGLQFHRTWAWERVLINLFLNAVRAMPHGGIIDVRARRRGSEIEITVRDEGPGIAYEVLDTLFRPHVSTKDSGGLGLHIVETIVEGDGGEVHAANRADRSGAEFIITVPAENAAAVSQSRIAHA